MKRMKEVKKSYAKSVEELESLFNLSALTWEGLREDDKNLKDLENWIYSNGVDTSNLEFVITKGSVMNRVYGLTGDNAYPNDLTIVSCKGIDTFPLSIRRFQIGGKWFDDIVENNARVQEEIEKR